MNNTPDNNTNIPAGNNKRSSPLLKFLKKKLDHVHLDKNLTAHDMDQIRVVKRAYA